MKKIITFAILIAGLVSITSANALVTFDWGNHNGNAPIISGPLFLDGTGTSTIDISVDVKYRVVRFEFKDLDRVFTQNNEISFSISPDVPLAYLAVTPYLSSELLTVAAFHQSPTFCANLACSSKIGAWTTGLQEQSFKNDGNGNLIFGGTVHPVAKKPLYTLGYVYDENMSWSGNFTPAKVDIEGEEYSILVPEIIDVHSVMSDIDFDDVPDLVDNCILVYNPGQEESDGDIYGNACDSVFDVTNDGLVDFGDVVTMLGFVNGEPYQAIYDVDFNGVVDFGDVVTLLGHINETIGPSGL